MFVAIFIVLVGSIFPFAASSAPRLPDAICDISGIIVEPPEKHRECHETYFTYQEEDGPEELIKQEECHEHYTLKIDVHSSFQENIPLELMKYGCEEKINEFVVTQSMIIDDEYEDLILSLEKGMCIEASNMSSLHTWNRWLFTSPKSTNLLFKIKKISDKNCKNDQ